MRISFISAFLVSCLVYLLGFGTHSHAQEIENGILKIEWQKKIDVSSKLAALDYSLMGENIDLHTGGISFSHTDIVLPGNSDLDVSLRRTRNMGQLHHADVDAEFGDWALVVPRINAIVGPSSPWKNTSGNRCSGSLTQNFPQEIVTIPPKILGNRNLGGTVIPGGQKYFQGSDYSNGIEMVIPGEGRKSVLKAWAGTDFHRPSTAVYTTSDAWYLTCIPVGGNEGFEATSPTGTQYTFNKVIIREAKELEFFDHDPDDTNLDRWRVSLMATRVEDVHGNWVEYDYNASGHLTAIRSYDGRQIDLTYSGDLIKTATANGRTWTYNYKQNTYTHRYWEAHTVAGPGNKVLHEVERPDTLKWSFGLDEMTSGPQPGENCAAPKRFLLVAHPQGAIGQYFIEDKMHRSSLDARTWDPDTCGPYGQGPDNVIPECDLPCTGSSGGAPVQRLKRIGVVSVTEKIIMTPNQFDDYANGTATDLSRWVYTYEEDNGPLSSSSNDRTNWTKVKDPLGNETTYFHKWHRERDGGSLIRQEMRAANGALVKSEEYEYELPTFGGTQTDQMIRAGYALGGAFEDNVNVPPCNSSDASSCFISGLSDDPMPPAGAIMHKVKHIVEQDGDTFTTEDVYGIDRASVSYSYGNPIETRSWSNYSISNEANKRITQTTYEHKKDKWILGLPKNVTRNGRLLSTTDYTPLGQVEKRYQYNQTTPVATYTYHSEGTLASVTDAVGRRTEAHDWHRGKPKRVERWKGSSLLQTMGRDVDDNSWIESQTDAKGRTTSYQRDSMGRLTHITPHTPAPGEGYKLPDTTIHYTFGDTIVQMITTGPKREFVYYDSLFRPVNELTYDFKTEKRIWTRTKYDALGRPIFKSQPSTVPWEAKGVETEYDALGRVTQTRENVYPHATTTHEYLSYHRKKVTDPEGRATTTYQYGWDGPDSGVSYLIEQHGVTQTWTRRNVHGQIWRVDQNNVAGTSQFNVNEQQHFYYDAQQRLCRTRTPEGGDTIYRYNDANEVIAYAKGQSAIGYCTSIYDNSAKVSLTYDDLGRLKTTDFVDPNTPDIWRDYDANGNMTKNYRGAGANAVNWDYTYDGNDMLRSEELTVDNKAFDIRYLYNAHGHMFRKYLPSGKGISYFTDGLGRHTKVGWGSATYADHASYHPNGTLTGLTFGNGAVFTQTLNTRLLPERLKVTHNGADRQNLYYDYYADGRIKHKLNYVDSTYSAIHFYDGAGRLERANSAAWGAAAYKYDALGNLREKRFNKNGVIRTVTNNYNSKNRIVGSTDTANINYGFGYDARGNVIATGLMGFRYDMSDQPVAVFPRVSGGKAPNTGTVVNASYTYDGNMKRVKSVVNGKTIYNVYDLSGRLVHIEDGGDETDYLHGMGQTLARIKNGTFTYLHPDHLGSPQLGTTEAGSVSFTEHYTPYGEALLSPAANDNQSGFTGHIKDKDTGLNYMQARYYDPNIGRFLSVDPVGFIGSGGNPGMFNRYSYTMNDPINAIDPDGRSKKSLLKETAKDIRKAVNNARARGRRAALKRERQQLQETGQSVSNLSSERASELLETGNLKGMHAHHDPSINNGTTKQEQVNIAQDPDNITFKEGGPHRQIHKDNGGTRVPIDTRNKLGAAVAGFGLTMMEGVADVLDLAAGVPDPISVSIEAGQILGSDCIQCEIENRLEDLE